MEGAARSLVGRDRELGILMSAIEDERPVAVIGEAGIGKTSLVRAAAAATGSRLHEGGGFATLRSAPYLALGRSVGLTLAGDAASVAATAERRVGPDILFIDDLQWVDRESLAAIELLAGRVLVITAIRRSDPRTDAAIDLARRLGSETVWLDGLDDVAAAEIVRRLRPALRGRDLERVVAGSGGNPLVLEEVATSGQPSPVLARAIGAGLERLSPPARDLVDLLAIADRPVARRDVPDGVDETIELGCVVDRDGAIELRHALIAERVRADLDEPTRVALHVRVAALVDDPIESARHLLSADRRTDATATAMTALGTVTDPTMRAALLLIVAEAAAPDAGLEPRLQAARALDGLSDWTSVTAVLDEAGPGGSPTQCAERDLLLAHASFSLGRHREARALLADAESYAIDPTGTVAARRAVESAAFLVNVDGDVPSAMAILEDALEAQPDGSAGHVAVRSISEAMHLMAAMDVDIGYLRAVADGSLAAGAFASAADLARVVGFAMLVEQGADAALAYLTEMGTRFGAAGAPQVALEFQAGMVQVAVFAGRPADALTFADEFLESPAPLRPRQSATIHRARALAMLGDLDGATESLDDLEPVVTDDFLGRGEMLATRADIALWGGTPERAIELATEVAAVTSPIRGAYALPGITRAWAEFEAGLRPRAVTGIEATRIMAGAVPELEGLDLLDAGRSDDAAARFAEAARWWAGYNVPRELICRWAEGESLRRAGRLEPAAARLEAVLDTVSSCRFEALAVRIRRSLRQAGVRLAPAAVTTRATGIALTRRELELIDLVGRGLTNIEIARRMGLGRPTVARILSNAMAKLGAETRAQAVILAGRSD